MHICLWSCLMCCLVMQERLGELPTAWQQAACTATPPDQLHQPCLGGNLHIVNQGAVVQTFLLQWHDSWVAGDRRGCLNACCDESG